MAALAGLGFFTFGNLKVHQTRAGRLDPAVALVVEWNRHALTAERYNEKYRVPTAARMYAYVGLAAYQAALPAHSERATSLAALFPGLELPEPAPAASYCLPVALNACYAELFQHFFPDAIKQVELDRARLEKKWHDQFLDSCDPATLLRSRDYGRAVAMAFFKWSETDPYGHEVLNQGKDHCYIPPQGEGKWEPCPDFPMPALLPYWGKARTFTIRTEDFVARPLPEYSTQPNSIYYKEALEVYTISSPLSHDNFWIAEFWSDDHPGITFTPAGRWISITNQVVEKAAPTLPKTLETYLKMGFALNDAAIACWHSKYIYNLERPETFIRKVFDPAWRSLHHTPPFPAYPSGHSMLSTAAAEVLTQLYGPDFELTDMSHKGRHEFKSAPRRYRSFNEMATENAFSRIPLGVHFRMDCEEGSRLGTLVGKEVNELFKRLEKGADYSLSKR